MRILLAGLRLSLCEKASLDTLLAQAHPKYWLTPKHQGFTCPSIPRCCRLTHPVARQPGGRAANLEAIHAPSMTVGNLANGRSCIELQELDQLAISRTPVLIFSHAW